MNAHPAAQTYTDAGNALAVMASMDRANRIGDAWRESLRRVENHLRMIRQHMATVSDAEGVKLSPREFRYVEQCRAQLATRLADYLRLVRRVSEAEDEMDRLGIAYARSSDAVEIGRAA